MPSISAVISTYQRPAECQRAIESALSQDPPPLEVLVCDDGSADDTPERINAIARRDERVRYLRVEPNRGTPAPARNLGVGAAKGDLVAFLDDDDEWLPGKLAAQLHHEADVIATNAITTTGDLYFPEAPPVRGPARKEILQANPVILSSALVNRQRLVPFPEETWLRGIEDYATWLAMADRGASFAVLGEPLVRYTSQGDARYSGSARVERAAARLAWRRVRENPRDRALLRAALNKTVVSLRRRP